MSRTGIVFNIQRFSIHDGPGIRTTVFLKGCNNRCSWCHNPESYKNEPELQFFPERCTGCGECFRVCQNGVHVFVDGKRLICREKCSHCRSCVDVCCSGALEMSGRCMDTDQVMDEVLKDKVYYDSSGGGVTFSGGEPVLQKGFLKELITASKAHSMHVTLQTAGNYDWEQLSDLLPYIDLIMYDIKILDNTKHIKYIGTDNSRIFHNLKNLSKTDKLFAVRTPVIAEVNDTPEEITGIAEIIKNYPGLLYYELIPYHSLGVSKYKQLGKVYSFDFRAPSKESMHQLADAARIYIPDVRHNRT